MSGGVLRLARREASTTADPTPTGPDPAATSPGTGREPRAGGHADPEVQAATGGEERCAERMPEPPAAGAASAGGPERGGQRFGGVFLEAPGGFLREVVRKDEVVTQELCNFWARIAAQVVVDDGAERATFYEIEAQVRRPRGPEVTFAVPAAEFAALGWVDTHLGALAVVAAGASNRLVATAIKERGIAAGTVRRREVFAHLGWRKVGERWAYLTGTDALGAGGVVEGVEVRPPARLGRYGLATGDATAAMRASLRLLLLAPARVTVPLWAAVWRAPFGSPETRRLAGRPHRRVQVRARRPGAAALRARPGRAALPAGLVEHRERHRGDPVRGQGRAGRGRRLRPRRDQGQPAGAGEQGRAGRARARQRGRAGRMSADGSQRPDRPPRAQAIVTGEDLPAAHSIRARSLIVPVAEGDVDTGRLTAAQEDAAAGVYERALAGFLVWLAGRYERTVERWRGLATAYRAALVAEGAHGRSPAALGQFLAAVEVLAEYLGEAGVEVPAEILDHLGEEVGVGASGLTRRMARVLVGTMGEQAEQQRGADPVRLFVEALGEALASGRAHVREVEGQGVPGPPRRAARLAAGRGRLGRGPAPGVARARRARGLGGGRAPLPQPAGGLRGGGPAAGRAGGGDAEAPGHALGRAARRRLGRAERPGAGPAAADLQEAGRRRAEEHARVAARGRRREPRRARPG